MFIFDELIGSLHAHEARINCTQEIMKKKPSRSRNQRRNFLEEKAFEMAIEAKVVDMVEAEV